MTSSGSPEGPETPEVVVCVPLRFDVPGAQLHCPMIDARVGGVATRLIVDTGATEHVLMARLVDEARFDRHPAEPGTDVTGALVPSWRAAGVVLAVGGAALPPGDLVAIEGPEPFAAWGVGGIVSPQRLWRQATVVVDLLDNTLSVFRGPPAVVCAAVAARAVGHETLEVVRHAAGTLGIDIRVLPGEQTVAILDTGAGTTEVEASLGMGAPTPSPGGRGISGAVQPAGELANRVLEIGRRRIHVKRLSVCERIAAPEGAPAHERPHALVGMDLLRGTILVIPPDDVSSVAWFVPRRWHPSDGTRAGNC